MKIKPRICEYCGKKFKPKVSKQIFCKIKCGQYNWVKNNKEKLKIKWRQYYYDNKEQCIESALRWQLKHPRKARAIHKKAFKKYMENNRELFNLRSNLYYYLHRDEHLSRVYVYKLLRVFKTKICKLNKVCSVCESRYEVWLFFDIYPLTKENILKAIKQNKIRYLCRRHWIEASKRRKLKYLRKQKLKK